MNKNVMPLVHIPKKEENEKMCHEIFGKIRLYYFFLNILLIHNIFLILDT
jgi:hypothetical protein